MTEGNPIWHESILSPQAIIFKLVLVPCLLIPLLGAILKPNIFHHLIRTLAFVFLEVVIFNSIGMSQPIPDEEARAYTMLEMVGLVSLLLYGGMCLTAASEALGKFVGKRGIHWDLERIFGRVWKCRVKDTSEKILAPVK